MAYGRRWKPSKTAKREFAQKMDEIDTFCAEHEIDQSRSSDSYYFSINGQEYRVSNHSVEASGVRYHPDGRKNSTVYIHAGKTRIMEIYNDLASGYKLDGRGCRV